MLSLRTSVVIPCFQEAQALAAWDAPLAALSADEILFVDDGSTDETPQRLAALASRDARVRIETHGRNRGVGAAMRTGLAAATGDVVVVYDADRTYPLGDVARLAGLVADGDCDVATATPLAAGGGLRDVPFGRRVLTRGAVLAYRLVLGRRARGLTVFTCAFRAYGPAARRGLSFRSDGFPAAAEILGRLVLSGARVVEVAAPLSARTEGQSKMRVGRALMGHLGTLGRLLGARLRRPARMTAE